MSTLNEVMKKNTDHRDCCFDYLKKIRKKTCVTVIRKIKRALTKYACTITTTLLESAFRDRVLENW